MTVEAKKETILASIEARGWFTTQIYYNEAAQLRDAGLVKIGTRYFVGGNEKMVWVAA